jgi:hypothetical protein
MDGEKGVPGIAGPRVRTIRLYDTICHILCPNSPYYIL